MSVTKKAIAGYHANIVTDERVICGSSHINLGLPMPIVDCICDNCRVTFKRAQNKLIYKHHFCSNKCKYEWMSRELRGERRYNFKSIKTNCYWCAKEILVRPSKMKEYKHHFCSRKCRYKAQSLYQSKENHPMWNNREYPCDNCGKKVMRSLGQIKGMKHIFCSHPCYTKWYSKNIRGDKTSQWKRGPKEYFCVTCGVPVYRTPSQVVGRVFCSITCANIWQTGENGPNWQGGHANYYGPNWGRQRRKARRRDKYTCQKCGGKEYEKEHPVHHIIAFKIFGLKRYREANKLSNLITYCNRCHLKFERETFRGGVSYEYITHE